jgi:hypothetical protein
MKIPYFQNRISPATARDGIKEQRRTVAGFYCGLFAVIKIVYIFASDYSLVKFIMK